jgi:hypothetical protein
LTGEYEIDFEIACVHGGKSSRNAVLLLGFGLARLTDWQARTTFMHTFVPPHVFLVCGQKCHKNRERLCCEEMFFFKLRLPQKDQCGSQLFKI